MIEEPISDPVFAGGGEMGQRMRAMDWSANPLGPVASWPQSLKTCIRIILTSRQPMFVWWGAELINLYNDAYKAIVGGKHPGALGQPASVVWREIWDQVGPRAETAMRANEGTYDQSLLLIMERNGYPEETYYTFSYSPVPNDEGGTGGILCANTDDTRQIIGERQLALLRELAARLANARSVQAVSEIAAIALGTNPRDLPFSAIYLMSADRRELHKAGSAGIGPDHAAVPARIAMDSPMGARLLDSFERTFERHDAKPVDADPRVPLPGGAWPTPPRQIAYVPIMPSGETGRPGILVVGLNPFRLFDEGYRGFLDLVAGQISAALANAQVSEQERRRAEALAEIDRAKTAFFSNVSHEFRTPLTLMLGPQEDALASAEQALAGDALVTVHRNTKRLLKLVNSLLDFARIEAGRVQASYEPTDLSALTRELASSFESAIERSGVVYVVDCPPLPDEVYVDRDMWEKIVLNLISNALKFTFEGSIRVAVRARGDAVELMVSDTGVGIPAQELPKLFERFHRVAGARARSHEGSGIGLALVHDLVKLHGGVVHVASELSRGTMFTIAIPRGTAHLPADRIAAERTLDHSSDRTSDRTSVHTSVRADAYVDEALRWLPGPPLLPDAEPTVGSPPANAVPARILVADDNADMREYITRLLRRAGWQVETATDGEQALARLRSHRADVVVTDVMMPNLDGFGLLRALRADPALADTAVILLSARAGEESRVEGLAHGANDYLVKPFSARELIARVQVQAASIHVRRLEREARRRLSELFTHAPVGIALLRGPEHVYELCNPSYLQLVGDRSIVGRPMREAMPELAGQGIFELLDRVYATGEPYSARGLSVTIACAERGPATQVYFDFAGQPMPEADGTIGGVLVVILDVTDQVHARQREHAARTEAERANRAKDEFLAMLGHELRNPLAPILTAVELMRIRAPDRLQREVTVVERQAQHLVRLVEDLLDVSRITRGKLELKKERIELSEAVARAIEQASPLIEQRKHDLRVDVRARGLALEADLDRLAQVIANLLTNAAKYTEIGGRITVTAARTPDRRIELKVRDTGIGIAPEMLPVVFDLFVQERQALDRSQGGLGLGLAIVQSFVTLHGGSVSASSAGRGQGAEFTILLPALDAQGAPALPPPLEPIASTPSRGGLRILLVDDNEDYADMLAQMLAAKGNRVRVVHDGPTALRIAREFAPQIAILDIGLPVMDGYELAQLLRERLGKDALRLVAMTGYGQEGDKRRARAAGFDAHLVKPVNAERVESVIRDLTAVHPTLSEDSPDPG